MELTKEIKEKVLELFERTGYCTHQKDKIHYQTICFDPENYNGVYRISKLETNEVIYVEISRTPNDLDPETNNYPVIILRSN